MRSLLAPLLAALALLAAPAARAEVTIKLGTLAPDGSPWHKKLKELADQFEKESAGAVKVKIFAGGVAGNEGDMVRKMRIGQLQAAAITIVGLRDIDAVPQAVGAPGMVANDAELACVMERMAPKFEALMLEKGFVVLAWADTGWGRFFFQKPVRTPADAAGLKIFAWAGDPGAVESWRLAGFVPVVISSTDMMPSLSTGMIQGFATSGIMAASARWYEKALHSPDARWGRLIGATVITREAWDKIPPELQPKLRQIAQKIGKDIDEAVGRMGVRAVEVMAKSGLQVVTLTDAEKAAWDRLAEGTWPAVRGGSIPAAQFDEVKAVRDACRAGRK